MANRRERNLQPNDLDLGQLPLGSKGDPITAEWLNRGIKGVNRLTGNAQRGQQVIRQSNSNAKQVTEVAMVVMTEAPSPTTGQMNVRRVTLGELDPPDAVTNAYAWLGEEFPAWIDFGTVTSAYHEHQWPAGTTPTVGTSFLVARKEEGRWYVELPPGGRASHQTGYITEAPDAAGLTTGVFKFQAIARPHIVAPLVLARLGAPFLVLTGYDVDPADYLPFVAPNGPPNQGDFDPRPDDDTELLTVRKHGELWVLEPPPVAPSATTIFYVNDPKVRINHLECRKGIDRNAPLVNVALPPELAYDDWRYGRDGVAFAITAFQGDRRFQVRTARRGQGDPERQHIVPWYNKDDRLLVSRPHGGTGMFLTDAGEGGVPTELEWMDMNGAGRVWSEEFNG